MNNLQKVPHSRAQQPFYFSKSVPILWSPTAMRHLLGRSVGGGSYHLPFPHITTQLYYPECVSLYPYTWNQCKSHAFHCVRGSHLNIKAVFPGIEITIIKMIRSLNRLCFVMGSSILARRHFYIETPPIPPPPPPPPPTPPSPTHPPPPTPHPPPSPPPSPPHEKSNPIKTKNKQISPRSYLHPFANTQFHLKCLCFKSQKIYLCRMSVYFF